MERTDRDMPNDLVIVLRDGNNNVLYGVRENGDIYYDEPVM